MPSPARAAAPPAAVPAEQAVSSPQGAVADAPSAGPYYFPPAELSRKPQPSDPVPLDYPADTPAVARGSIVLRLLINEAGGVDRIVVEKSELPKELEELAKQAFSQSRFQPGLREGRAVNSQMMIEVTFEDEQAPPRK